MDRVRSMLNEAYKKIFSEAGDQDQTPATEYYHKIQGLKQFAGYDAAGEETRDLVRYFKEKEADVENWEADIARCEKKIKEGKISISHLPPDAPERQSWERKEQAWIEGKAVIQDHKRRIRLAKEILLGPGN